jgi:hypothetical protein
MALLDVSGYDLKTPAGQNQAIQDIIAENNIQFDQLNTVSSFSVVAYVQLNVNLINGQPTGTYSQSYIHGLGYPPAVIAFFLSQGGSFYAPTPYDDAEFGTPAGISKTYQYFSVDDNNLYYNVFGLDLGGFFSTNAFSAGFYIFDIPLGQ